MIMAPAVLELEDELLEEPRREELAGAGAWQPPGAIAPPRQCPSCGGGLQPADPDDSRCFTCRWPGLTRGGVPMDPVIPNHRVRRSKALPPLNPRGASETAAASGAASTRMRGGPHGGP